MSLSFSHPVASLSPARTIGAGYNALPGITNVRSGPGILNQGFVDFEGGTDGANCSSATLNASIRGGVTAGTGWLTQGTGAVMKFASAASRPPIGSVGPLLDGSTIAAGAGSMGVQYLTATSNSYLRWDLNGNNGQIDSDDFTCCIWFKTNLPNNDESNMDIFTVYAPSGGNFANCKFLGAPSGLTRIFQLEVGGGGGNSHVEIPTATDILIALRYRRVGQHELRAYNTSGTLLGTIQETSNGVGRASYIAIGQASSNVPTSGFFCNFDSLRVDFDGTWPLSA